MKAFKDYIWKNGIPIGVSPVKIDEGLAYKIIVDPYQKRFSIEQYQKGIFEKIVYDSLLLDFRHLKMLDQTAWERVKISEAENSMICIIKNQEDRVIFQETYHFKDGFCRTCHLHSIHGYLLSVNKMSYIALQDSFNGITLYDSNDHFVMEKRYEVDSDTHEFTTLIKETWQE